VIAGQPYDYGFDLAKVTKACKIWAELSEDLTDDEAIVIGGILHRMMYVRSRWVSDYLYRARDVDASLIEHVGDRMRLTDTALERVYRAVED
jgi:hypothetical protein